MLYWFDYYYFMEKGMFLNLGFLFFIRICFLRFFKFYLEDYVYNIKLDLNIIDWIIVNSDIFFVEIIKLLFKFVNVV